MCPALSRVPATELRVLGGLELPAHWNKENGLSASTAPGSSPSAVPFTPLIGLHPLDWGCRGWALSRGHKAAVTGKGGSHTYPTFHVQCS